MVAAVPKTDQAQGNLATVPTLGVGMGYRDVVGADILAHRKAIDFLEITADHFMDGTRDRWNHLDLLARHFTLIPHGLNLSLGSAEGLNEPYLEKFAELIERVNPPYWSEHIAFTRAGGIEIGHLTPLPFTAQAVDVVCRNVERARRRIQRPLILENITYSVTLGGEMTETRFLSEILARTDCGLLLDVTNLYANSVNHHYDARRFLDEIPLDRVVQLHFVGGAWRDGVFIDDHSAPTPPEIWALLEQVLARAAVKGVILERDENIPSFADLAGELARARDLGRRHNRWA